MPYGEFPRRVSEAREWVSDFLQKTGCYDICTECPVYGEEGCCSGCSRLVRGVGCSKKNLSCLTYTCGVLNFHLLQIPDGEYGNALNRFVTLTVSLPREGYRGSERLPDDFPVEEKIQLGG